MRVNNKRRKMLRKASGYLSQALELIATVNDEELEVYSRMSESAQDSVRGDEYLEVLDGLDEAICNLQAAQQALDSVWE